MKRTDNAGQTKPAVANKAKSYATQPHPFPNRDEVDNVKINYNDSYNLIGRLLTYVDATYQDKEQREAHKGILKRTIKEWMVDLYREQYPDKTEYHF